VQELANFAVSSLVSRLGSLSVPTMNGMVKVLAWNEGGAAANVVGFRSTDNVSAFPNAPVQFAGVLITTVPARSSNSAAGCVQVLPAHGSPR
jgi:hypothetical protein